MIIRKSNAEVRKTDFMELRNYVTGAHNATFSLAVAVLSGAHPPTMNSESDRAYLILEGSAIVELDTELFEVGSGDAVLIPHGTRHAIRGNARYILVNSPAFNPANEHPA